MSGYAFSNTELQTIDIPDGVTNIGEHCFHFCKSLTHVKLPSQLKVIGDGAFYMSPRITQIVIPDGVSVIGKYFFYKCSSLTSVKLPASLQSFGEKAFEGTNIREIVIPEGCT